MDKFLTKWEKLVFIIICIIWFLFGFHQMAILLNSANAQKRSYEKIKIIEENLIDPATIGFGIVRRNITILCIEGYKYIIVTSAHGMSIVQAYNDNKPSRPQRCQ